MYQTGLLHVLLSPLLRLVRSMGNSCRNLKPRVQVIFSYADLAYPHIGSLLADSVKIMSWKTERKVCFDSISEVETLRD